MSRFRPIAGTISVISLGCLVAALVQAQDASRFWTAAKGVRSGAPARGSQLVDQYRSAGQAVTASYAGELANQPSDSGAQSPIALTAHQDQTTMLVSDEAPASTGLRSVLKRNSAPASAAAQSAAAQAQAPAPSPPPASPAIAAETDAPPTPPASIATGQPPSVTARPPAAATSTSEAVLSAPAASLASPATEGEETAEERVSSRRTQRPDVATSSPAEVTAKPVPSPRADSSARASGPTSNATEAPTTLSKTVGPALRVEVIGPAAALLGDETLFKIQLLNQGEVDAEGVSVQIGVPAGVRVVKAEAGAGQARVQAEGDLNRIVWTVERLQAQAAGNLNLTVVPTAEQPIELSVDWSLQPIATAARIEVKQPLLEVALNGPSEMVYGETKVFSIVLSNPGSGDARNVAVNVALGPTMSDTMQVGTIPAGTSKTFDFEVTARQTGTMEIAATASGSGSLKQEVAHPVAVLRAELEIEASGPELEYAGAVGSYGVRVANHGNAAARNVQVLVRIPQGARYLQGVGNVRQDASGMIWQLGDLAPAAERLLTFDCELLSHGDLSFEVTARGDGVVEVADELLTRVEGVADLKLSVNDPKGPIPVGQEVAYEINVVNRGSTAATQVLVFAQFSEGIEPVATDGMPGEIQTGQVIFQPIARINPQETVQLVVKAKAQANGNHVFRAAVQCSDPETRLVAEDNTRFYGGSPSPTHSGIASSSDEHAEVPQIGEVPEETDPVYRR